MAEASAPSTFLSPKFEELDLGDRTIKFFPISASLLFQLKPIAAPILKAILEVMSSNVNDVSIEERSTHSATEGMTGNERIISAIAPELVRTRAELQSKSIDACLETLMSESSRLIVGRLLMDSMREEPGMGPAAARNATKVGAFVDSIDAPTMVRMFVALSKANEEVLAPFMGAIPAQTAARIKSAMSAAQPTKSGEKPALQPAQPSPLASEETPKDA